MKDTARIILTGVITGIITTFITLLLTPIISHFISPFGILQLIIIFILSTVIVIGGLYFVSYIISGRKKDSFRVGGINFPPTGLLTHRIKYPMYDVIWPISFVDEPLVGIRSVFVHYPQCPNSECQRDLTHKEQGRIFKKFVLACESCGTKYPAEEFVVDMTDKVRDDFKAFLRREGYDI